MLWCSLLGCFKGMTLWDFFELLKRTLEGGKFCVCLACMSEACGKVFTGWEVVGQHWSVWWTWALHTPFISVSSCSPWDTSESWISPPSKAGKTPFCEYFAAANSFGCFYCIHKSYKLPPRIFPWPTNAHHSACTISFVSMHSKSMPVKLRTWLCRKPRSMNFPKWPATEQPEWWLWFHGIRLIKAAKTSPGCRIQLLEVIIFWAWFLGILLRHARTLLPVRKLCLICLRIDWYYGY